MNIQNCWVFLFFFKFEDVMIFHYDVKMENYWFLCRLFSFPQHFWLQNVRKECILIPISNEKISNYQHCCDLNISCTVLCRQDDISLHVYRQCRSVNSLTYWQVLSTTWHCQISPLMQWEDPDYIDMDQVFSSLYQVYPRELKDMTFEEISQVMKNIWDQRRNWSLQRSSWQKYKNRMKQSYSIFTDWSRHQDFVSLKNLEQKKGPSKKNCYN